MKTRIHAWWATVRDSLWLVPTLLTAAGATLAVLMGEVDRRVAAVDDLPSWLFAGGAEGARGVLGAIASGIITVTGVVFSVTIVALQLASSQYSPRVLRNFTSDRATQIVLGVFIGTFTYALLVQRTVRAPVDGADAAVPGISVTVAIVLALVSIGFLIFFINHLAESIQAARIVERAAQQTREAAERLFPRGVGTGVVEEEELDPDDVVPGETPAEVRATSSGYLQALDEEGLMKLAEDGNLLLRLEHRIGEFILTGQTVVSIWPAVAVDGGLEKELRETFILGADRTQHQDVERGIGELVDIAVKALSPSINDPTTATICIDRLAEVLQALGTLDLPSPLRLDESGELRVITPRLSFSRAVEVACGPIRHYSAGQPQVVLRQLDALERLARVLPERRRMVLRRQARLTLEAAMREIRSPEERTRIEEAAARVLSVEAGGSEAARRDGKEARAKVPDGV